MANKIPEGWTNEPDMFGGRTYVHANGCKIRRTNSKRGWDLSFPGNFQHTQHYKLADAAVYAEENFAKLANISVKGY